MRDRRTFIKDVGSATAGVLVGSGLAKAAGTSMMQTSPGGRRQVMVGGRRIKTIDVHTHVYVRAVIPLLKNVEWGNTVKSAASGSRGNRLTPDFLGPESVKWMDDHGIDVQARSINPYWATAERPLATRLIAVQNEALAADCAKFPGRFVPMATVALQFPDLAAQQLEDAVKKYNMTGVAIAANVAGEELGSARLDPFWAKVQELGVYVFIHPQGDGRFERDRAYPAGFSERLRGMGNLGNVIGYPMETTLAFSHLIFGGTLDRFPGLRICGAHGGGYLPAYTGRMDASCNFGGGAANCKPLKKKPSEYFKEQLFCDSLVFNPEELQLRVKQFGAGQVVLGTDHPAPWPAGGVDHILQTPGLSDAEKIAILGGNLSKLMKIPQFEATT